MADQGVGTLIGLTIVLDDQKDPEDPTNQGVIRWIYLAPLARYHTALFGWLTWVTYEYVLTAVFRDSDGDLNECPVDGIRMHIPKVVQGLREEDQEIAVTHLYKVPPEPPASMVITGDGVRIETRG